MPRLPVQRGSCDLTGVSGLTRQPDVAADRCMAALQDSGLEVDWTPFVPGAGWDLAYQPEPSLDAFARLDPAGARGAATPPAGCALANPVVTDGGRLRPPDRAELTASTCAERAEVVRRILRDAADGYTRIHN